MASFLDRCRFSPTAGGTTDWTFSSAVTGYQSPSAAGVVNGALYRYGAESADLTQWEVGYGTYNTSTGVLARTTVLFNSSGTTSKINFTATPQVAIVALAEDIGGWINRRLAKTAAYTVAQADCGMTLALSGGFFALTFPSAPTLDANHVNVLTNEDGSRAKLIHAVQVTSSTSLTVGTGSKAFTTSATLATFNKRIRAYSLATPSNWMSGTFVSQSGGVLTLNIDTTNGSGTAADWQIGHETLLWPRQSTTVFSDNGLWVFNPTDQPWIPESAPTLIVDSSLGSDANDGLATGSGGALKTLKRATNIAYQSIYTQDIGSITIDGQSGTYQEFIQTFYQINGGGTLIYQNFTWKPANSGYCLQWGDGAMTGVTNINFSTAGTTTPVGIFTGHNHGVLDVNTGVQITPTVAMSGDVFGNDGSGDTRININNGITVNAGTISGFLYNGNASGMKFYVLGSHVFNGTLTINRFCWLSLCSQMVMNASFTNNGSVTISVGLINQNGVMLNVSGVAPPGGAITPTTGGQYNTSQTA